MGSIVTRGAAKDPHRRGRWLGAGVAVVALLLFARFLPNTAPESDYAVIDLSVLNVLRGAQPVGMYSRFGWHHPGPLYFALLSPFYWLSGLRHFAINAGVVTLNVACVLGVFAILRRQKMAAATTVAAAIVFGAYLLGSRDLLASPWTPHVVLLPLALLMIASAALACGQLWALPVAALCASFVIQTHLGSALCVGVVVAVATVTAIFRGGSWRGPAFAALAIVLVAWAAPIADELRATGTHNLRAIARFFWHAQPAAGAAATYAFEYFFIAPFSPRFGLSWGPAQPPAQSWVAVLAAAQLLLLVFATARSLRRHQTFQAMLGILTIAGAAAAYTSIRRLPETPKDYTVLWVSILGVLSWIVIAGAVVKPREATRSRMTLGIIALALLAATQVTIRRLDDQNASARLDPLMTAVRKATREAGVATVLVHVPQSLWGRAAAVVLDLAREGRSPRVDPEWTAMFGRPYAPTGREPAEISFVDAGEHALLGRRTDEQLLGRADDLFVYFRAAPRQVRVAALPIALEGSRETMGDLAAGLTFIGAGAFAQFAIPDVSPLGVRLLGQGGTRWRLTCSGETGAFDEAGGVTIAGGPGTQSGDAFLRDFSRCRHLRVYATSASVTQRLSRIQLLTR